MVRFDLIDGAVRRHNARKNRDTGYTPNDIWNNNILYTEKTEPFNMTAKDTTPQFDVDDYVRVTRRPRILEKRSLTSKWSQDLVEVVDIDYHLIRFKQAPFLFEYVNMLSEKRAKSKTTVEKNLYKLLANSTYGKFVETGLKRMKVKFANTWNEREAIIQKIVYKWPKSVEKGDRIEYGRKRDEKISRVWRHLLTTLIIIIITMIMFGMNR